jgi:hypothetical protein
MFNDEDLKRLKKSAYEFCLDTDEATEDINVLRLRDLLARLECAEICANALENLVEVQKLKGTAKAIVETWLASKGSKEER